MAHETRKKSLIKKHNLSGVNKPKRTPKHKTKSHVVLAQDGHTLKLIRFGQQGVSGAGKNPKTAKDTLSIFTGDTQVEDCSQLRDHVAQRFLVETTCISKGEHILMQDKKVYFFALPKK